MIWFVIIGILFIVVEILTPTVFFFFAFGLSFIINSFVYKTTENLSLSLVLTGITTIVLFYLIKKSNIFKSKTDYKSNMTNYIGKTCIIEEVLPNKSYRIKIFSEIWTAKSEEVLNKGEFCKILGRVDNTLIIKKQ